MGNDDYPIFIIVILLLMFASIIYIGGQLLSDEIGEKGTEYFISALCGAITLTIFGSGILFLLYMFIIEYVL